MSGGIVGVRGVLGAHKECRYSGARRDIGGIRALGAPRGCSGYQKAVRGVRGCWGVKGVLGAGRECRYPGARRGIGGIRWHWGLLGGLGGIRGCYGVEGCHGCMGDLHGVEVLSGKKVIGGIRGYWGAPTGVGGIINNNNNTNIKLFIINRKCM